MEQENDLAELVERLCAAQREQWSVGRRIPVEVQLARHPLLRRYPLLALELVYQEMLLREEEGETPRLEEYVARFPGLRSHLIPLFEVHQALESGYLAGLLPESR